MKPDFYTVVGQYYDEEAREFDKRYWKNPVLQQIRQKFREEVLRHEFSSLLEIGMGTGIDLAYFGSTHPEVIIKGIDVSKQMHAITSQKLAKLQLTHVECKQAKVEDIPIVFPNQQFDLIYVFFGALNTVDDLQQQAEILKRSLKPGGKMVLSFVNKWYLMGMLLECLRFRFSRAFARIRPIWGGYSPVKYLPSRCYSPLQIKKAFSSMEIVNRQGFSILHPAWYFTGINKKLGRMSRILWNIDLKLNRTFLWRFGEYSLFTFKQSDGSG